MSLVNFFVKKPLMWVNRHLFGVERGTQKAQEQINVLAPIAQNLLNNNKERVIEAIHDFADREVEGLIKRTFRSEGLRKRLNDAIGELGLGSHLTGYVEGLLYGVALPAGENITRDQLRSLETQLVQLVRNA